MRPVQDSALVVLALVVGVLIFFMVVGTRPVGTSDGGSSSSVAAPSATSGDVVPPTDAEETATPGDRQRTTAVAPGDSEVTATATPGDRQRTTTVAPGDAEETATLTGDPEGRTTGTATAAATASVQEARDLLAADDPVTVVVLGDSTGDSLTDWVHLWARDLGQRRPVLISHRDPTSGTRYYQAITYGDGGDAGEAVTIWNGSVADGTAASGLESIDDLVPQPPDIVLLNYGHGQTITDFADEADALTSELEVRYGDIPVLLVLQNPQLDDANAEVRSAGAQWAAEAGVGVIDVAGAFPEGGGDLLLDAVQPNGAGQELWARVVADALG